VTHLLAVVTLDLGPVLGLRAVAREVTGLLAVAAEGFVRVLGLITVLGHMLGGVTVSAGPGGNVGTLWSLARTRDGLLDKCTYILGEVTGLVALAALDTFSRTRFGTLLGVMTLLLAVLAGVWVDALLGTVACAMAVLLAVDTLNLGSSVLTLSLLLLAVLAYVTKLTTVAAHRDTTILDVAT